MGNLTAMQHFRMVGTGLIGPVPSTFSSMAVLSYINLANNSLNGDFPSALSALTQLRHVNLSRISWQGPWMGDLAEPLQSSLPWDLESNAFNGTIPGQITGLVRPPDTQHECQLFLGQLTVFPGQVAGPLFPGPIPE